MIPLLASNRREIVRLFVPVAIVALFCVASISAVRAQTIVSSDYQLPARFQSVAGGGSINTGSERRGSGFCYSWSYNGFSSGCTFPDGLSALADGASFAEGRLRTLASQSGYPEVQVITRMGQPIATPTGSVLYTGSPNAYQYSLCPPGQVQVSQNQCWPVRDLKVPPPPDVCPYNPPQGNPIYPATGVKRESVDTGVAISGQNLVFSYDTGRANWGSQFLPLEGDVTSYGDLGKLWYVSLFDKLVQNPNGQSVQLVRGNGSVQSFVNIGNLWATRQDSSNSLARLPDGTFVFKDQSRSLQEVFSSQSDLQTITLNSGLSLLVTLSTSQTPVAVAPKPGLIIQVADPFGRSIQFTYKSISTGPGGIVVDQITEPTGRVIVAGYDSRANLTSLTWQDGSVKAFAYKSPNLNQSWALTGILDESNAQYAAFSYHENGWASSTAHADGADVFTANYGSGPQPVARDIPDATNSVVWRCHEWAAGDNSSVAQPNGVSLGLKFTSVPGDGSNGPGRCNLLRFAGFTQEAGAGCTRSSSNQAYDENGNLAVKDDFNGNRTCLAYTKNGVDAGAANLEKVRVEGLSNTVGCSGVLADGASLPTASRKISVKWHPAWAIKTAQAEPLLLTTWVYNGQPDPFNGGQIANCVTPKYGASTVPSLPDGSAIAVLCKKVMQSTEDATGAQGFSARPSSSPSAPNLRQWSYSYNQYGQLLTSTDPRGNTLTYVYYDSTEFVGADPTASGHYMGDLKSITNAAGHVTMFNAYDKAGRVLSKTDPSGLVTVNAYWPRGWLKASKQCESATCDVGTSVGGLLTTYEYWPTGMLKKVVSPDGGYLTYSYDNSHRLTGISDAVGNTITYTLDNSGNRTGEQVKDASGVLARNVTRIYDALNRLQQVTGAEQ